MSGCDNCGLVVDASSYVRVDGSALKYQKKVFCSELCASAFLSNRVRNPAKQDGDDTMGRRIVKVPCFLCQRYFAPQEVHKWEANPETGKAYSDSFLNPRTGNINHPWPQKGAFQPVCADCISAASLKSKILETMGGAQYLQFVNRQRREKAKFKQAKKVN